MAAKWTDEKAKAAYDGIQQQLDTMFRAPQPIAQAEPHIFQSWMYSQQCKAAHLRIEAAHLFLTFTKAPS